MSWVAAAIAGSGVVGGAASYFGAGKFTAGRSNYSETPRDVLIQSGGAPLLMQVALGADVDGAIASYFGASSYEGLLSGKGPQGSQLTLADLKSLEGVRNQLKQIQGNTELRNKAVQQVVNDFPNMVSQQAQRVVQAKRAAGEEFDATTQGYINLALGKTASQYAAKGGLSSGAMNEAMAKTGAEMGMQRLDYTTGRGDIAYNELLGDWQNKYTEANALRNFQQTMLGQGVQQGFSAQQNALSRNAGAASTNAGLSSQANMLGQESTQAMYEAVGQASGSSLVYALLRNNNPPDKVPTAQPGKAPMAQPGRAPTTNVPNTYSGYSKLDLGSAS